MNNSIINLIKTRHSTRAPFDPTKPVAGQDLEQILEAGSWAPTAHNMQNFEVLAINDKKLLEKIGNIKSRASVDFIRENSKLLSFSEKELQKKKTGILGAGFPAQWRNPDANFEKIARESAPSPLKYTIKGSPLILIVIYDQRKRAPASENDVLGMISLGCAMENMWLMAESLGISFQIMSVFSGETVEKELKKLLSIPGFMKTAYAIRLGYRLVPSTNYLRVRRKVEDFTHHNGYKNK